jgi:hypothetical protein
MYSDNRIRFPHPATVSAILGCGLAVPANNAGRNTIVSLYPRLAKPSSVRPLLLENMVIVRCRKIGGRGTAHGPGIQEFGFRICAKGLFMLGETRKVGGRLKRASRKDRQDVGGDWSHQIWQPEPHL